jgi:hypothetical protein
MAGFLVGWVFELETDFVHDIRKHLPADFSQGCAFEDRSGRRRLELRPDGTARVPAGYSWDGCSPKFLVWDCALGIPDGVPNRLTRKPKAYYASLLHDAMYQFQDVGLAELLPREKCDLIFLELLTRDDFQPARFYYRVVRMLGGVFRRFTHWKRSYNGRKVPL